MFKRFFKFLFPFRSKKISVIPEVKAIDETPAISERELYLEQRLKDLETMNFEDYIADRMLVDTGDGFQIKFLGENVVRVISKSLYYLVKDSDNYLVFTFKNAEHLTGVDVYVVKEGRLVPAETLEELEEENKLLKEELRKESN